ncbi:MAG: GAF domain-containing protein [Spirochaetes bacterium]|nr:GAF domain-containing protein [Spirochaetota bacterium]
MELTVLSGKEKDEEFGMRVLLICSSSQLSNKIDHSIKETASKIIKVSSADPKQLKNKLGKTTIDIILIDFIVEKKSMSIFEEIQKSHPNVPVILLLNEEDHINKISKLLESQLVESIMIDQKEQYLTLLPIIMKKKYTNWLQTAGYVQCSHFMDTFMNMIPDFLYFKDKDCKYLAISQAFAEFSQIPKEECVGKDDFDLLPPKLAEMCKKSDEKVLQKSGMITIEETANIDQEDFFFKTIKAPILNEQKKFNGIIGLSIDITEHKKVEKTLQKLVDEQQIISDIAKALNTLEVSDAFPVLVEGLMRLTSCESINLALVHERNNTVKIITLTNHSSSLEDGEIFFYSDSGLISELSNNVLFNIKELNKDSIFLDEKYLYKRGWRSYINIPLYIGRVIIGSICLASSKRQHFESALVPILQQVANFLASALENNRLFENEQRQRKQANTLRESALVLTEALNLEEVIERILAQLQKVVPYDSCTVQLLGSEFNTDQNKKMTKHNVVEIVGGRGFSNISNLIGLSFEIGSNNPNTKVINSRSTFIVEDIPLEYSDFNRAPHNETGIHSWMGVPMLVRKRIIGMIALDKKKIGYYTQQHAQIAEAFTAQAAVAIENARLFEAERKRATQLAVVNQVARKAVSILEPSHLLQEIVDSIQKGFNYKNIILLQYNQKKNELGNIAVAGEFKDLLPENYSQDAGIGLMGWTIENGKSILVNDVEKDDRYFMGFPRYVPTQSELCVPLKLEDQVIGVLDVQETKINAFEESDLIAMETLADQIAVAIDNARLYKQAQKDSETKSVLLDEVNHRVKNNLTGIIGLLYSARNNTPVNNSESYKEAMNDMIGRVRGLASVHNMLSESEWAPLQLSYLVEQIVQTALRTYPDQKNISLAIEHSSVKVTSNQAHNLALVINELVTNTIKYATKDQKKTIISFQVSVENDRIICIFRDNGDGYPEEVLNLESHNMGFDLIKNIIQGILHGQLELSNDHGAVTRIQFGLLV